MLQCKIRHLRHSQLQESLGGVCTGEFTALEGQGRQGSLIQSYLVASTEVSITGEIPGQGSEPLPGWGDVKVTGTSVAVTWHQAPRSCHVVTPEHQPLMDNVGSTTQGQGVEKGAQLLSFRFFWGAWPSLALSC